MTCIVDRYLPECNWDAGRIQPGYNGFTKPPDLCNFVNQSVQFCRHKALCYPGISYIPGECVDFMVLHAIRALLATDCVLKIKIGNKQEPKPTNFLKKKPCNAHPDKTNSPARNQYRVQKKTPRQNKPPRKNPYNPPPDKKSSPART